MAGEDATSVGPRAQSVLFRTECTINGSFGTCNDACSIKSVIHECQSSGNRDVVINQHVMVVASARTIAESGRRPKKSTRIRGASLVLFAALADILDACVHFRRDIGRLP